MWQGQSNPNRSRRGRSTLALTGVAALASALVAGCGSSSHKSTAAPSSSSSSSSAASVSPTNPATTAAPASSTCPLSGMPAPGGKAPQRQALGVKIDNLSPARPQYGLSAADVIYEEPVEGGLTRYIAIFQCHDAPRVEPVRSGRLIDPQILMQYGGHPLLAYSGGIDAAVAAIDSSSLIDVGANREGGAFYRDPARVVPHNLATSTAALWSAGASEHAPTWAPPSPFDFGPVGLGATPAASINIGWQVSSVTWTWNPQAGVYFRSYSDTGAATYAEGGAMAANDVIVMHVVMYPSQYVEDATGAHENLLELTGSNKLEVYRNGARISGTWSRPALTDKTQYLDSSGHAINLQPGRIWIELVPTTISATSTP